MSDQQKDDTLAGIGNYLPGPASASLCAAGDSIPWDGYTPQEQDISTSYQALSWSPDHPNQARLTHTQQLTNQVTQEFGELLSGSQHQQQQQQCYDGNNACIDLQLQEIPIDEEWTDYLYCHPSASSDSPGWPNSRPNDLTRPSYPITHTDNGVGTLAEQVDTCEVTGSHSQNMSTNVDHIVPLDNSASEWSHSGLQKKDNYVTGFEDMALSPRNKTLASPGHTLTSFLPQSIRDGSVPSEESPYQYTQLIDNGTCAGFRGRVHCSPGSTTAPSHVPTSVFSGTGPPHGLASATSTSSNRRPRPRPRPRARSTSLQTSFSHESNGSRPFPRGKRNGPMDPVKNMQAQKTRGEKSVCAGCKFRKVKCQRREESDTCDACKKKNAWLPCVKHFFSSDLKTLPEYQSGLFLINSASFPASLKSSSAEKIDFAHYSPYLAEFNQFYHARLQSQGLYYDLDLVACQQHWEQARLDYDDPLGSCTVEDFITSKHKWQETMTCHAMLVVPNPHKNWDDPLEAFSTLDKMSGCVEFSLMPKTDNSTSRMSVPGPGKDASEYLHYVVMLIFERTRHHLELAAYSRLEQDLVAGEVNTRIMTFLVVLLFSLRRRIAICKGTRIREDTRAGYPSQGTQASTECSGIERMTYFCFQLYVHYFCRYSKMISATASEIISEQVTIDLDTYASIMDCWPTVPTKQGFLDWMKDGEDLYMSPAWA